MFVQWLDKLLQRSASKEEVVIIDMAHNEDVIKGNLLLNLVKFVNQVPRYRSDHVLIQTFKSNLKWTVFL